MSTLAINQRITFSETINRNTLILVFFLSGFAGLIYESIWTQYLKLFLGHAAYAQTLVLIIFMGGMALGAWLASKYLHKFKNLFLAYAIVEAIVGIFALVFHNIYVTSTDFSYNIVMPFLGSSLQIEVFKWSLATLLILPQTILLGSTFPLMSAGFIHYFPEKKGHSLSILYFSNSFGAAIGVLVAGFYLVHTVGLPGTLLTAGLINFAVALISWITSKQFVDESIQSTHLDKQEVETHKTLKVLLIVAAITGAASFMYEVAWIRMLSMVLGSSVHSFELMLSAFILGLAIGGFWIRNKISKITNPIQWLGYIQIIMGILAALTIVFYNYTFDFMAFTMHALQRTEPGYIYFNLVSHAICLVIMLPATICAGMTLPLITYILLENGYNERSIGWVYSSNTIGSILGVVIAVQIVIPLFGLKNLIVIGSTIDILIGIIALALFKYKLKTKFVAFILSPLLLSFINFNELKMASGVYRSGTLPNSDLSNIIYHADGKTATVAVIKQRKEKNTRIYISTNGKTDASATISQDHPPTPDEDTMILTAAIPMAIKSNISSVAIVGIGSGISSHVFLSNPQIESVDTIEIEKEMVEGAKFFKNFNFRIFDDARSNIHIADARTFFFSNQKKYDVIMSEPSNPWVSGVASLYTTEFYSLIKKFIKEDGLFVQWLQIYEIDINLVFSAFRALGENFNDYIVYASNQGDLIIVSSPNKKIDINYIDIFNIDNIRSDLSRIKHSSIDDIIIHEITNKAILSKIINKTKTNPNSDYFPIIQQKSDKTRYFKSSAHAIFDLKLSHITKIKTNNKINIKNLNKENTFFIAQKISQTNKSNITLKNSIYNKEFFCKNNGLLDEWIKKTATSLYTSSWLNKKVALDHIEAHFKDSCPVEKVNNLKEYFTSIATNKYSDTIKQVEKFILLNNTIDLPMRVSYSYALAKLNYKEDAKREVSEINRKVKNNLIVTYIDALLD
ncbi:MFS transporter [Spartinivicinus poritis]|uniref:MFS transporter n=1 Tax=Spartinivicinus poritis TaxID=2994640 RepID=A0ABT5U944_9GAMM|nr:MFS transporter [Spartinivicinus sp. A2-2]MDE1462812.1 MFS transporter [Spartinivicinus sp. A2-2]